MKLKFYEDQGPMMMIMGDDRVVDVLRALPPRSAVFHLCPALVGVIRGVQYGSAVPRIEVPFRLQFPRTAFLCFEIPVGGNAKVWMELRPNSSPERYPDACRMIYTTTMTPKALADFLRDTLVTLAKEQMNHMLENDPLCLQGVGEALAIYNNEAGSLAWPERHSEIHALVS